VRQKRKSVCGTEKRKQEGEKKLWQEEVHPKAAVHKNSSRAARNQVEQGARRYVNPSLCSEWWAIKEGRGRGMVDRPRKIRRKITRKTTRQSTHQKKKRLEVRCKRSEGQQAGGKTQKKTPGEKERAFSDVE